LHTRSPQASPAPLSAQASQTAPVVAINAAVPAKRDDIQDEDG
jgi:hypothetical protein